MVNLKEKRLKKGLTQEQLAEKLFVTRQAISFYECGTRKPPVDMMKLLGEVLGFEWREFYE